MSRRTALGLATLAAILVVVVVVGLFGTAARPRTHPGSAPEEVATTTPISTRGRAEAARSPELPNTGPTEAEHLAVRVRGRAILPGRHPVAQAAVELRDGPRVLQAGIADELGRFDLGILGDAPAQVDVLLADPRTSRARRLSRAVGGCEDIFLGDVLLVGARSLSITVMGGGTPVAGARVMVTMEDPGSRLVAASSVTGQDGRLSLDGLPLQGLRVFAASPGFGRGDVRAERGSTSVVVQLPGERVLQIEVVDEEEHLPLEGIRVTVEELRVDGEMTGTATLSPVLVAQPAPTDSSGITVLRGLSPDAAFRIHVSDSPEYAALGVEGVRSVSVPPRVERTVLALGSPRSVTWPISEQGDVDPPREGTRIRFLDMENRQVLPDGSVVGGNIVATRVPRGRAGLLAVADSGDLARVLVPAAGQHGDPVSFYRAREVRVSVVDEDGRPVAGVGIEAKVAGADRPLRDTVLTDVTGTAVLAGLYPYRYLDAEKGFFEARIECLPFPPSRDAVRTVGSVDLGRVTHALEVVLPQEEILTLEFLVKGEPALPTDLLVSGPSVASVPVAEDPSTGEVRYRVRRVRTGQPMLLNVFTTWGKLEDLIVPGNRARIELPP